MASAETSNKINIFKSFFSGLTHVYGTYDPETGRTWQVKAPVTEDTFLAHLKGLRPYGVYLLTGTQTRAVAADFDEPDPFAPIEFVHAANHYGLQAYIEISKSKGFHVWIFFDEKGVEAAKARAIVSRILEEIGCPQTEVFPKQDVLDSPDKFGNFIYAPLFGRLVPNGKTVFVDPYTLKPYKNQWQFLQTAERAGESLLDDIMALNDLKVSQPPHDPNLKPQTSAQEINRYSLPPCAQMMLNEGVTQLQRVSCFRLAVHLKRLGLPGDLVLAALKTWAQKNRPTGGKKKISDSEIHAQVAYVFDRSYRGYGCDSAAVRPFCQPGCPVKNHPSTSSGAAQ